MVDVIENNKLQGLIKKMNTNNPKQIKYHELSIVENYYDISDSLQVNKSTDE